MNIKNIFNNKLTQLVLTKGNLAFGYGPILSQDRLSYQEFSQAKFYLNGFTSTIFNPVASV